MALIKPTSKSQKRSNLPSTNMEADSNVSKLATSLMGQAQSTQRNRGVPPLTSNWGQDAPAPFPPPDTNQTRPQALHAKRKSLVLLS